MGSLTQKAIHESLCTSRSVYFLFPMALLPEFFVQKHRAALPFPIPVSTDGWISVCPSQAAWAPCKHGGCYLPGWLWVFPGFIPALEVPFHLLPWHFLSLPLGVATGSPGVCLVLTCGPAALCYWLPFSSWVPELALKQSCILEVPISFKEEGYLHTKYREQFIWRDYVFYSSSKFCVNFFPTKTPCFPVLPTYNEGKPEIMSMLVCFEGDAMLFSVLWQAEKQCTGKCWSRCEDTYMWP